MHLGQIIFFGTQQYVPTPLYLLSFLKYTDSSWKTKEKPKDEPCSQPRMVIKSFH